MKRWYVVARESDSFHVHPGRPERDEEGRIILSNTFGRRLEGIVKWWK